ncbi:putative aldehyde dehydrogenase-like protein like [Verticillium longisporum]|uniref:aldehyde dehydrogenase (NAD(+)) n=2 Tax=Verticillium longisporum TaxID=100787 RepID=A0A8I2ZMC5_VERLO|nr:putative aldehyde dehydrogenase-like protein like [Verticillium longisporum]
MRCSPKSLLLRQAVRQRPHTCPSLISRNLSAAAHCRLEVELTAPNGVTWKQPQGLFINNEFVKSSNGQQITTVNPFTEQPICSVHAATESDVDSAVAAARAAFKHPSWRDLSSSARGQLLHNLADLVEANALTLATIETLDNGKPLSASLTQDIPDLVSVLRYYAGWADKRHGQTMDLGPAKLAYTVRQPLGVCAQIIPWNYPLSMAGWKLAPALAAGNTLVLKPAEQTPLSMLYLASLVPAAGLPRGVLNVLNGRGPDAGAALAAHAGVDKLAFTGSTPTGRAVMRLAAATLKPVTLETGGKSPLLVFPDADLDRAARWAHDGLMANAGQVCTATSRLLVHEDVHDAFLARFLAVVRDVSVLGDPFAPSTFQGPQITHKQQQDILARVADAVAEGATLALGGEAAMPSSPDGTGFFVPPTVLTDVTPRMRVFQDEIFGPCAAVTRFRDEAEAVALANDSAYGLGAAVFTRDLARAHRVARDVEAGMVWINSSNDADYRVPFGGVKQSGVGRELGEAGIEAYTVAKSVHVNLEASEAP